MRKKIEIIYGVASVIMTATYLWLLGALVIWLNEIRLFCEYLAKGNPSQIAQNTGKYFTYWIEQAWGLSEPYFYFAVLNPCVLFIVGIIAVISTIIGATALSVSIQFASLTRED